MPCWMKRWMRLVEQRAAVKRTTHCYSCCSLSDERPVVSGWMMERMTKMKRMREKRALRLNWQNCSQCPVRIWPYSKLDDDDWCRCSHRCRPKSNWPASYQAHRYRALDCTTYPNYKCTRHASYRRSNSTIAASSSVCPSSTMSRSGAFGSY